MSTQEKNLSVNAPAEELSEENLSEQRQIRREKLKKLREAGRDPFLQENWNVTAHSMDIKENFDAMEDEEVSCAGRIMAFRRMGKMAFVDIQDKQGRIQINAKLMEHAGLTDKAVLVGSLWLIQIVSPETWDLIEAGGNDGFFDVMQRINDTPDGLAGVLKGFAQQ